MDPELVALAAAGGKALVDAMATDTWHTARHAVARLFSQHAKERDTAVSAQLDGNQALVVVADEPDQARASLAPLWEMELVALLKKHPDAEAELRRLVDDIRAALPESTQAWTQTNIARDGSRLFAAQGGNVVVHEAGPPPREQPETNEPSARR
jgi:hypothetical protein